MNELTTIGGSELMTSTTTPADRNPALVYLARLSAGSRPAQGEALSKMASMLTGGRATIATTDWSALRYQHVAALKARLIEEPTVDGKPRSPATVNRFLSALRGVVRESWRLGLIGAEELRRVEDVESIKVKTLPAGRALSLVEIQRLIESCDLSKAGGARDAAALAVLFGAGLRRAELVALELADYDQESGELKVRSGKGRKDRIVYATNGSKTLLDVWLTHRGVEPGPLFVPVLKGGKVTLRPMTPQSIYKLLGVMATEAGIKSFSPHDLRRTFVSELLDRGADLSVVQQLAGHSSITTTARYDRRPEVAKRRAAELLHVPVPAK